MHFASAWNHLPKHCISAEFLLVEGYLQSAIRKELRIASFVQHICLLEVAVALRQLNPVHKKGP